MADIEKLEGDVEVNVAEVVDYLKVTGAFAPALRAVVERKLAVAAARKAGLEVPDTELQETADAFRALKGLRKADDTQQWLDTSGISLDTLEAHLEANILMAKFKDSLESLALEKGEYAENEEVRSAVRDLAFTDWVKQALA